uniref:Uncharacterized protein n=1 Tax=Tanacetum cinerariifolium TaxID=118510 RepID=A0A699IX01_TANCI|nr:hypothetical protein [Tanacetum cinerariifolium]
MSGFDGTEIVRVLAGHHVTVAAMADAFNSYSLTFKLFLCDTVTSMNDIDGTEIVHVVAGQPITVAAMAVTFATVFVVFQRHATDDDYAATSRMRLQPWRVFCNVSIFADLSLGSTSSFVVLASRFSNENAMYDSFHTYRK